MTIIEAIKSGKRYRRPAWPDYMKPPRFFTEDDVLATDWEIEEESVTVTRSQASKAASDLVSASFECYGGHMNMGLEAFMKALGFKE